MVLNFFNFLFLFYGFFISNVLDLLLIWWRWK